MIEFTILESANNRLLRVDKMEVIPHIDTYNKIKCIFPSAWNGYNITCIIEKVGGIYQILNMVSGVINTIPDIVLNTSDDLKISFHGGVGENFAESTVCKVPLVVSNIDEVPYVPINPVNNRQQYDDIIQNYIDANILIDEINLKLDLINDTNKTFTTALRPTIKTVGYTCFDTTLNKPIWLKTTPSVWVDATGAVV